MLVDITEKKYKNIGIQILDAMSNHIPTLKRIEKGLYINIGGNFEHRIEEKSESFWVSKLLKKHMDNFFGKTGEERNEIARIKYHILGKWFDWESFGVCDSIEQFKKRYLWQLQSYPYNFAVGFMPVYKKDQPEWGGWRWHKWGHYIGEHEIECEYLHDEDNIKTIYCYYILRILDKEVKQ